MKKIILIDASSCCSICFEELDPGMEVYIDKENDIVCSNCHDTIITKEKSELC